MVLLSGIQKCDGEKHGDTVEEGTDKTPFKVQTDQVCEFRGEF